jgi:ABC-type transport system substrate-binding protein
VIGVTNPLNLGYTHQAGNSLLWEGLYYYGIFSDRDIPWLAKRMEYTKPDFTELTIYLNEQALWSDEVPVTSKDLVYTFEEQMQNDKLSYHADFNQFVQKVKAVDDHTVVVVFKSPAPRFKFEVLTLKFDSGLPILPAHVLSKQADVTEFAGGLDIPHSGPYNLIVWNADQKLYDLRSDWWAVRAGLLQEPAVKRVAILNLPGDMDTAALRIVNNEYDSVVDLRSEVMANILRQNPKITAHTGSAPPYGYLDWWPNSLWVNTQLPPYNDARVRRAISLAIDRDKINEILYAGAPIATIYPFPLYPGLQKFVDSPEVQALEAKYQPGKFDLDQSAKLMTEAGFVKNVDGLWAKDGKVVNATINGFELIHGDIALLLVEMLKKGGFDTSAYFGDDAFDRMTRGDPGLYLFGHGASLIDPYAAFELYHSRHSAPTGTPNATYFSRYSNPEYDMIVDAMSILSSDDPKFQKLAVQALEIYWKETIDIPMIQWLHRIPYNETYWTNWPTEANPAAGINGAYWHQTAMLMITNLQPSP